jgi:hypothetical protein
MSSDRANFFTNFELLFSGTEACKEITILLNTKDAGCEPDGNIYYYRRTELLHALKAN